jgi:preprotein translocase subunit SecF
METEGAETRAEQITVRYCIAGIPVTRLLFIVALAVLFVALCVAVFANETESRGCDLQSGLAATLNLSQTQCENMRQLTDRFRNDIRQSQEGRLWKNALSLESSPKTRKQIHMQ